MVWQLNDIATTSAGNVVAGICGDGPALVLAHGWPWSSFSWHRVIPTLANRYRVYWYDMPGYGQSDKHPDQRTSLDVQGKIFTEMIKHWGLVRPAVVAHDFGGATVLRAHLLHDCEFSSLVLMNVVAMRPWGSEFFNHVGRNVEVFSQLPSHIHKAVVEAYIRGAMVNELDTQDIVQLVAPWISESGKESFYRQFAQADERYTAELEPLYGTIRCPVGIVWGEDDPWIPLARGKALRERIPQASFQTLKAVGHLPQLEAPPQVIEVIGQILAAHTNFDSAQRER